MNNIELMSRLKCIPSFNGVFPRDMIPRNMKNNGSIIVNTDPAHKKGAHWLAMDNEIFFDSYGFTPEYYNFDRNGREYNKMFLQSPFSATCGYWAAYFVLMRSRGLTLYQLINRFSEQDLSMNDKMVIDIVNRLAPDYNLCTCLEHIQSCTSYC